MTDESQRSGPPLLEVRDLDVRFGARGRAGEVMAVRGVSFIIAPGEVLGLIGESGSGKTTVARAVMGLVGSATGRICFEGREILGLSKRELRQVRRRLQLIFQDPYDSLHPGMRVREIVQEAMKIHGVGDLALARHLCDRIAVMFRGELVEVGPTETVIANPLHPYTETLLRAVEELTPTAPHEPDHQASDRYDWVEESCATIDSRLREVTPGHYVACHPNNEIVWDRHMPEKKE